jgi:hypothetical protein
LTPADVAEAFAPVIYQDVADGPWNDPAMRRLDLLATVDFDGTMDPTDSVEHVEDHALPGAVYWDAVETETHWFLLYAFFHPVDWNELGFIDHENDMEHAWLVVEKHADGTLTLLAAHTQAHGEFFAWSDAALSGNYALEEEGLSMDGDHLRLFIESHGHGPAMCGFAGGLPFTEAIDCEPAAEEDLVVYTVADEASEPDVSEGGVVEAGYVLVSAYEALWPLRASIEGEGGEMWDEPFEWAPGRNADADGDNDFPAVDARWGADFESVPRGDDWQRAGHRPGPPLRRDAGPRPPGPRHGRHGWTRHG